MEERHFKLLRQTLDYIGKIGFLFVCFFENKHLENPVRESSTAFGEINRSIPANSKV